MFDFFLYILIGIEVITFVAMIIKLFQQKEIVDIKTTKYFFPTVIINLLIYGIAIFELEIHNNFFTAVINIIGTSLSACFLNVDFGLVEGLMAESQLFSIAFIFSYIITLFTLIFVVVGLVGRQFINFIKCKIKLFSKKEKIIIIGYNQDSHKFAKTVENKRLFIWHPTPSKEDKKYILSKKHLNAIFEPITKESLQKMTNGFTTFVCFLEDIQAVIKFIENYKTITTNKFNLYVSIDVKYEDTFKSTYNASGITFFNKHELIAQKFILDHPITSYLNENQLDLEHAVVDKDTDINVFILGYGPTNKTIFKKMVIDNQFPCIINNQFHHKKVNYYIFDQNQLTDKDFNFNLSRIFDYKFNSEDYYELPSKPMEYEYIQTDIYGKNFNKIINEKLSKINKENHLNYCILSFGEELQNIDFMIKLKTLFTEKGATNTKFFTHIKIQTYAHMFNDIKNCIPFGEYDILNYNTIIADQLNSLSIDRNFQEELKREEVIEVYEDINAISSIKKQKQALQYLKISLWNKQESLTKDLSSYNSMNIRTKLNLCGLDIKGSEQISNREFYAIYDNKGEIETEKRQKVYHYPYPQSLSIRNSLAFQELLHLNAYWFIKGYIPAKKSVINKVKDRKFIETLPETREITSLTTFDGLDQIIQNKIKLIEAKNWQCDISENIDEKKHLYQVMDNLPLYKYSNYLIYKKFDKK